MNCTAATTSSIGQVLDSKKLGIKKMYADETKQQLIAYLNADEKYFVSPLPVHFIKKEITDLLIAELTKGVRGNKLKRLSKLIAFYGVNEAAVLLDKMLTISTNVPLSFLDSAIVIKSVKWVGDGTQQETARKVLMKIMQSNLADELNRFLLLDVFMDWGSSLNIKILVDWLDKGIKYFELQKQIAEKNNDKDAIEVAEINIEDLSYFKDREVKLLEHNNKTREAIMSLPMEEKVQQLAKLYLIDIDESSIQLSFWSSVLLIRLAEQSPKITERIVNEFIKLSNDFHVPPLAGETDGDDGLDEQDADEEGSQAEVDLIRASCLRAALFFGGVITEKDKSWLDVQNDEGLDLLQKRPTWKYVEHGH